MAEEKSKSTSQNPFIDLSWEDLINWAGNKIVNRGRTYQRNTSVSDLGITPEGAIIAWVFGTKRYTTHVEIRNGKLLSTCTCPYAGTCKHAVAVILEYMEHVKNNFEVPQIPETDPRLDLQPARDKIAGQYWEPGLGMRRTGPMTDRETRTETLSAYLEKQSKAQLVALLGDLMDAFPDVKAVLSDRQNVHSGKTSTLLKTIRRELDIREPNWDDYDAGYQPINFDRLKAYLHALLQAGQADDILQVGKEMIDSLSFAIETYDHEGDLIDEGAVAPCIEIVFRALTASSLSPSEQLIWAVDLELADEYGFFDEELYAFRDGPHKKSHWRALADELQKRLNAMKADNFRRGRLTEWLIDALEGAGCENEIIPLYEREAEITGNYTALIALLIEEKRFEDAENGCRKAIANAGPHHPDTCSKLKDYLCTIREKTGDHLGAAAFYADEFFEQPSLPAFQELCEAARKVNAGTAVKAWARYFLKTGHLPRTQGRKRKGEPDCKWPLPATGFQQDIHPSRVPNTQILIDIAIAEQKPTEVLKWYDLKTPQTENSWSHSGTSSLKVAQAIKEKYPERAIEIWKAQAESAISRVQVSGYQEAGGYLREVRDALKRLKRDREWEAYLRDLRNQNDRRPRCLEVLDGLAGKRIID